MKKLLSLLMSAVILVTLTACSGGDSVTESTEPVEIGLVTDYGSIDDKAFNQGAWEGVVKYAQESGKTYKYYRPTEKSTDGFLDGIQMAVKSGAKIIVCPGFLFEAAIFKAQEAYPDVKFLILDGVPQDGTYSEFKTADNTYSVVYAEEQSGFMAGYAAVMEGFRNLGFMGGTAVPPVVRFGYGYIQGAEYAAKELGLNEGDVKIKYNYTGSFDPDPEKQTKAASWYQTGTEVIFSCGALISNNVTAAAEGSGEGKYVIGVDVDQKAESETVITSAMKNLTGTVYTVLKEFYEGQFRGGVNDTLGAESDAVGLPTDFSRFKNFTQYQYDALYDLVKYDVDGITSSIIRDTQDGKTVTIDDIKANLEIVEVESIA